MSEPEIDRDDPDAESMFDFLAEGGGDKRTRRKTPQNDGERSLPIIRKPVPISQSGPLLPPKPGSPVEPPPQLTGSTVTEPVDDFGFLDNLEHDESAAASARAPEPTNLRPAAGRSANRVPDSGNVTRFPSKKPQAEHEHAKTQSSAQQRASAEHRGSQDYLGKKADRFRTRPPSQQAKPNHQIADFDDFDLDTRDNDRFPNDWQEGIHAARIAENDGYDSSRFRWLVAAFVLIAAGMGSLLYKSPPLWLAERFSQTTASVDGSLSGSDEVADANAVVLNPTDSTNGQAAEISAGEIVVSPLMQRFTEQLSRINALTDAGSLDEAEQALAALDRTVYGYGAYEFSELEARIAQIRSGAGDPAAAPQEEQVVLAQNTAQLESQQEEEARLAAQAAAQAQAEREEQLRLAQEQAQLEEQARLAQEGEEVRLEEQARLTAQADQERATRELEEAWLAESQRVEEAERIEAAAVQEALRAAKAAQDLVAQQEQIRLEEQAQQAADTQARARQQAVDADRQATDRRIAEERAAVERQRARELRLVQAREREAAILAQQTAPATIPAQAIELAVIEQASEPVSVETVVSGPQPITDEDLQQVYQQFSELQEAIRNRDINTVVGLTQRSGVRVQQFMQMFENSVEIDSRIQNVSTRNATGEISGTLRINTIRRNDGLITEPPVSLSSIPLTSRREGSGWSAILW